VGELQAHGFLTAIGLIICPPFVLSLVIGPTPDSDLALVLIVGTIVFANAFLYAGVAAGGYFIFSLTARRERGNKCPSPTTDYRQLTTGLSRRLLLRHAMQRAQSPDQVTAINSHNLAIGEYCGQRVQRDAVVGIAE